MTDLGAGDGGMPHMTRTQLLKFAGVGAALFSLPDFLTATGASAATSISRATKTLTIAWTASVPNLDPYRVLDVWSLTVGLLGLERLVQPSDTGKLMPWLAESWSNPDPLTYKFKIRTGVTFWDGSPLTAEDVAFSLARHLNPASQDNFFFAEVKSVRATGKNEVTVRMRTPMPVFVNGLAYAPIFSKSFANQHKQDFGSPAGSTLTIMGTGAYKFTSFVADKEIVATRYEKYWGPKPAFEEVKTQFITDPQTLQLAFRQGAVDWTPAIPLDQSAQWERISGVKVNFSPPLTSIFLGFNVNKPPFNDVHARRAVAHCCDNVGMVRALLRGHGEAATTLVPPGQWGGAMTAQQARRRYSQLRGYPFSIAKAKKELALSQYPKGFSATIRVPNIASYYTEAALAISHNLKQIGVNLKVLSVPFSEYVTHYRNHDQLIYWLRTSPDYANGANIPLAFYPSAGAVPNAFNLADYKNPKIDALLRAWPKTTNVTRQTELMLRILRISQEDLPYVPIWWESVASGIQRKYVYRGKFNALYFQQPWYNRIRPTG